MTGFSSTRRPAKILESLPFSCNLRKRRTRRGAAASAKQCNAQSADKGGRMIRRRAQAKQDWALFPYGWRSSAQPPSVQLPFRATPFSAQPMTAARSSNAVEWGRALLGRARRSKVLSKLDERGGYG